MKWGIFLLLFYLSFTINPAFGGVGTPVKNIPRVIDTIQHPPDSGSTLPSTNNNLEKVPSSGNASQNQPANISPVTTPSPATSTTHKNKTVLILITIIILIAVTLACLVYLRKIKAEKE